MYALALGKPQAVVADDDLEEEQGVEMESLSFRRSGQHETQTTGTLQTDSSGLRP